jgi:transposase
MVRPDMAKWGQSLADLRRLAIESAHPRTRERFLALYEIGSGRMSAKRWAEANGCQIETVLRWLHRYNDQGPEAVVYQRTGGRLPLFRQRR